MSLHTRSAMLRQYGEHVLEAAEDGLDKAEGYILERLEEASPKGTGGFSRAWEGSGRKYKLARFIRNSKMVPSKTSGEIPLSNILEYSKRHGKPFIRRTIKNSTAAACAAAVKEIKTKL